MCVELSEEEYIRKFVAETLLVGLPDGFLRGCLKLNLSVVLFERMNITKKIFYKRIDIV